MAVDYLKTLAPETGLARSVRILRPDGENSFLWTVAVDIGQERLDGPDAGIDMSWVGAAGLRRGPTLARAAGEAVERGALIPGVELESGAGLPPAPRGANWADTPSVPALKTYAAARCYPDGSPDRSTGRVGVPAGAVDFPAEADTSPGIFDPGPSGTASGIDLAMAANSAAKELIERSAAMLAWDRPETARRMGHCSDEFGPHVRELATKARNRGVELELVQLEEPRGHAVWMAVAIDRRHQLVGAGLGLEKDPAQGVLRAVQESLQIRSLLISLKGYEGEVAVAPPITTEMARARYWAADQSVPRVREWLARVPQTGDGAAAQLTAHERDHPWLESLPAYTLVDLSPRLPAGIQEMGWRAVKIFCEALQPLRMSDALEWNVLGGPAASSGQRNPLPHPFI